MTDQEYINDAFMAHCHRTEFEGRLSELPLEEQVLVLNEANILKTAARVRSEAMKAYGAQPMDHERA
jgi:hypothetical protein